MAVSLAWEPPWPRLKSWNSNSSSRPRVLSSSIRFRLCAGRRLRRKSEVSVYYDTDTYKLQTHGLKLRVRRIGKARKQTIKSARPGWLARDEWEQEIESDAPDLQLARARLFNRL